MNILITGGTGFIGRKLCSLLDQHNVTILTRNKARARRILSSKVALVESLTELSKDTDLDAIINLAGEPIADKRWSASRKKLLESSRIDLTHELLRFIQGLTAKPKVLISGSAIGYYGDCGDNTVTEFSTPTDEFTHRLCASWEMQALRAKAYDLRVCIIRTGLVVGPNGGFISKMLPAFRFGLGGKLGDGTQWMSWIHLQDLTNLILFLMENDDAKGIYNATAPNPVTNAEFTKTLGHVLHRPTPLNLPKSFLELVFGELAHILVTGQKVIPKHAVNEGFEFTYPELEQALKSFL